jgi:hypothetical protein
LRRLLDKLPGHGLIVANYLADMPHVEVRDPQDNAGPGIPGLSKDEVTPQEELAAFDQLGATHTKSY